jgi:hypothetical protein
LFLYLPIRETLYSAELGRYRSFGLAAFRVADWRIERVASVSDISPAERMVSALACRYTRLQLYPIHLRDMIEDVL